MLGDNLGLYCNRGFAESFNVNRFCRICSATSATSQIRAYKNENLVRTVKSYESDVVKNNLKETGIKERFIFNNLNKFHISDNITVDIMHDHIAS